MTTFDYPEMVQTLYDGTARYKQVNPLNGINFLLHFSWNGRDDHWYVSVHDEDDVPIKGYTSRKLVANWEMSWHCTDPNQPYGVLMVSTTGHDDPELQSLGLGTRLLFWPYK